MVWEDGNVPEVNGGGGYTAMKLDLLSLTVGEWQLNDNLKCLRQLIQSLKYKLKKREKLGGGGARL